MSIIGYARVSTTDQDQSIQREQLEAKKVSPRVLDMSGLDTATSLGQLLLGVLASVAQFERTMIRGRQSDGVKAAKLRAPIRVVSNQPTESDEDKGTGRPRSTEECYRTATKDPSHNGV